MVVAVGVAVMVLVVVIMTMDMIVVVAREWQCWGGNAGGNDDCVVVINIEGLMTMVSKTAVQG